MLKISSLSPRWLEIAKGVKGLQSSSAVEHSPRVFLSSESHPARKPGGSVPMQVLGYYCMLPAWANYAL